MLVDDIATNKTHKVALFVALVVVMVVTVADNFTLAVDEYAFCFLVVWWWWVIW